MAGITQGRHSMTILTHILTPEQIQRLEVGPELDRLVAEACGLVQRDDDLGWLAWFDEHGNDYGVVSSENSHTHRSGFGEMAVWLPSVSDSDAMVAADKSGLIEFDEKFVIEFDNDGWFAGPQRTDYDVGYVWSWEVRFLKCSETLPLAICRAILALKSEGKR